MTDPLKELLAGLPLPGSPTAWQFATATLISVVLYFALRALIGKWREAVLRTEEAWDDALLNAAESRAYGLYFIAALNLTLIWIYGQGSEVDSNTSDYFIGAYILLATSLTSVVIKHFAPLLLDRFTRKSAVTVSGGNPAPDFPREVRGLVLRPPTRDGEVRHRAHRGAGVARRVLPDHRSGHPTESRKHRELLPPVAGQAIRRR